LWERVWRELIKVPRDSGEVVAFRLATVKRIAAASTTRQTVDKFLRQSVFISMSLLSAQIVE
jgi:hypothetical protein